MNKAIKNFLTFFLISWLIFSLARTFFNISKIFTEEISWIRMSDDDKREKLFGDLYKLAQFVMKKTPENSQIILLSPGGKTFFVSRYYLYPRKITYARSIYEMNKYLKKYKYNYLVVFQTPEKDLNEYNSMKWKITKAPQFMYSNFMNKKSKLSIYKL